MVEVKPLWAHQKKLVELIYTIGYFAVFADPGTGKTRTCIEALRKFFVREGRVMRTLILCPPVVVTNWLREWFLYSKVGPRVVTLTGTGKQRLKTFQDAVAKDPNFIVVTNYESLLMPALYAALLEWCPEIFVADESHRLRNIKTKRTKLSIRLAALAIHRILLTGTPILNGPMDLFGQWLILDGGKLFGKNFFVFRATYFEDKNQGMPKSKYFPDWRIRPGALAALNAAIKSTSLVVKKSECLDLPPLVYQTIHVELSKEQRRLYDAMKKDFVAYVGDKACVASLAITKLLRMQQICSGFIALEGDSEARSNTTIAENPRATALSEVLEEIAPVAKVIVWAVFIQDYETIRKVCTKLGLSFVEVHGGISAKAKQEAVDRFNTEEDCRVFLGHPASGGVGINLVAASYSVVYSRNFSLENELQSEARNYRAGSERFDKITKINLVATGTVDELVAERLAAKQSVSDDILLDVVGWL